MKKSIVICCAFFTFAWMIYGCGSNEASRSGQALSGKDLYTEYCSVCHGDDGRKGLAGAKDLSVSTLSEEEMRKVVEFGKGAMAGFHDQLAAEEIDKVVAYTETLRKQ